MKTKIKKLICIAMALYIAIILSIVVYAEQTPSEYKNNAYQYKQKLASTYTNYSFDDGKIYSWNYADEPNLSNTSDVVPYWNSGTPSVSYGMHGKIIDDCNAVTINPIPEQYLNLVKRTCQKCDQYYSSYTAFHAGGNYIATLKYLWDFANEIDKLTTINNTIINSIGDKCYTDLPKNTKTTTKEELRDITKKLVRNNYEIPSGTTNQTELKRAKYVLYGIMYHFLGDLYAHRLIVPKISIKPFEENFDANSNSFNPERMFDPNDFVDNLESELIEKVNSKTLQFNKIRNYYATNPSRNYADSPTFFPGRVNEAIMTMQYFTDFIDYGFVDGSLPPVNNVVELYNYENYLEKMEISYD